MKNNKNEVGLIPLNNMNKLEQLNKLKKLNEIEFIDTFEIMDIEEKLDFDTVNSDDCGCSSNYIC